MHGELSQQEGRYQLRFERRLPHPPEKVWRALTEPHHLEAWFPAAIEGERAAGARVGPGVLLGHGAPPIFRARRPRASSVSSASNRRAQRSR